uniref:Vinculin n=1 Tax=Steinernema glaseri TaxID=37863 RepID=A0A1I7YAX7_9BILA
MVSGPFWNSGPTSKIVLLLEKCEAIKHGREEEDLLRRLPDPTAKISAVSEQLTAVSDNLITYAANQQPHRQSYHGHAQQHRGRPNYQRFDGHRQEPIFRQRQDRYGPRQDSPFRQGRDRNGQHQGQLSCSLRILNRTI